MKFRSPPEEFLTPEELARLQAIESEGQARLEKHREYSQKMKDKVPLTAAEKVDVRSNLAAVTALAAERKALLDKDPFLMENIIKEFTPDADDP